MKKNALPGGALQMDEEEPRAAPINPIALRRLSKGQQYMVSVIQGPHHQQLVH